MAMCASQIIIMSIRSIHKINVNGKINLKKKKKIRHSASLINHLQDIVTKIKVLCAFLSFWLGTFFQSNRIKTLDWGKFCFTKDFSGIL